MKSAIQILGVLLVFTFKTAICFGDPTSLRGTITVPVFSDFQKDKMLTPAEMRADLDYYTFAITHAYSGFQFAPEQGSQALIDLLSAWQPSSSVSAADFSEFLFANSDLVHDGHFIAVAPGLPSERPIHPRPGNGVGKNFGINLRATWELNWFSASHKIAVFSIHRFSSYNNKEWTGFLSSVQAEASKNDILIVNMRGNGGGDDSMGGELAKLLLDASEAPTPLESAVHLQNVFSLEIMLNALDFNIAQGDQGYFPTKNQFENWLTEARAGTLPLVNLDDDSKVNPTPGPNAYKGKLFVIIDRNTASSGESSTDMLRTLPFATVVGENSAGDIHFGNQGLCELPNSKIIVGMGINYVQYRDKKYRELVGIDPDIRVPDGKDAIEYLDSTGSL